MSITPTLSAARAKLVNIRPNERTRCEKERFRRRVVGITKKASKMHSDFGVKIFLAIGDMETNFLFNSEVGTSWLPTGENKATILRDTSYTTIPTAARPTNNGVDHAAILAASEPVHVVNNSMSMLNVDAEIRDGESATDSGGEDAGDDLVINREDVRTPPILLVSPMVHRGKGFPAVVRIEAAQVKTMPPVLEKSPM